MGSVNIYIISLFILKVQIELLIFQVNALKLNLEKPQCAYQLRSKYLLLFVKEITQLFTNSRLYSVVMLFVICMDLVVNDHLDLGLVL